MKIFPLFCFLLIPSLLASEKEIRSYQLSPSTLRTAHWETVSENETDYEKSDWLGPIIDESPFQSRFLKAPKTLRNVTKRIGEIIGVKKFEGTAVYLEKQHRLVVQSKARWHNSLKRHLDHRIITNLRTEISIYQIPGVIRKKRNLLSMTPPKDAELLTSLTCLHLPGRSYAGKTPTGDLAVDLEGQIDGDDGYAEIRTTLTIKHPKARGRWKTGFAIPNGTYIIHEVGSLDGENTILAVFKTDRTTTSGAPLDHWIEKEKDGFFLLKQRLAGLQYFSHLDRKDFKEEGFSQVSVHPTFETFVATAFDDDESDPFAKEPNNHFRAPNFDPMPLELRDFENESLLNLQTMMERNGLSFRPGDFVAFDPPKALIYVKLSDNQMELFEGIITPAGLGPPRNISIDLLEVELADPATEWKPGEGKILRKMSTPLLTGQVCTSEVGEKLRAEFESQIDSNDELIEVRMSLFENGDFENANLKSSFTVQNNVPLVIQEKRTGTQRKAWVLTARVLAIDHEIRDLFEREKPGH